jgi:hypothetical protein
MSRPSRDEPLELPGEEWRKVEDFPGYEVSTLGRFRSYWRPNGLNDTPRLKSIIKNRYMKVSVHTENGNTLVLFSKLVAEAFLGKANGRVIAYLDDNIENCRLDNLAYVTRPELGKIISQRRYLHDPVNSNLGKKIAAQRAYHARLERARKVKSLRDSDKLTFKEIGKQLGLSESGAYRIYSGSNNHMLAKALAQ